MNKRPWMRWLDSCSDNRKSKIENPKWVGIFAIGVTLAMCGAVAEAQQQARVPRIGWLSSSGDSGSGRDYVDGKNRSLDTQSAQFKLDPLQAKAEELVRLKVDVLVASSTAEALALKRATSTIPIVFIVSSDPVADGLVDSLARPGGNITGITTVVPALAGRRIELLKEIIPNLSRVAVLWNPQDPSSGQAWRETRLAGRELGLQLHPLEVSSVDKLEGAFKEAVKEKSAALAVLPSPLLATHPRLIADLARRHRLPAIFDRRELAANGGLMSYGPDPAEPYRRAAAMVEKILKGAKPADIPVEQPTKFELVLNLTAAKQINLTIPPGLLSRAEKISQ